MKGKVKWFSKDKGYGFIVDSNGFDLFFGLQDIQGQDLPNSGDLVSFDTAQAKKGPKAINVILSQKTLKDSDNRVMCLKCDKKMTPRIITGPPIFNNSRNWTPVPKKSICPFCSSTYKNFPLSFGEIFKLSIIGFIILWIII